MLILISVRSTSPPSLKVFLKNLGGMYFQGHLCTVPVSNLPCLDGKLWVPFVIFSSSSNYRADYRSASRVTGSLEVHKVVPCYTYRGDKGDDTTPTCFQKDSLM